MIPRPPTLKELEVLVVYQGGAALSIKHASELIPLTYDAVATRIGLLAGKGAIERVPPLADRHVLERPYVITARGLSFVTATEREPLCPPLDTACRT